MCGQHGPTLHGPVPLTCFHHNPIRQALCARDGPTPAGSCERHPTHARHNRRGVRCDRQRSPRDSSGASFAARQSKNGAQSSQVKARARTASRAPRSEAAAGQVQLRSTAKVPARSNGHGRIDPWFSLWSRLPCSAHGGVDRWLSRSIRSRRSPLAKRSCGSNGAASRTRRCVRLRPPSQRSWGHPPHIPRPCAWWRRSARAEGKETLRARTTRTNERAQGGSIDVRWLPTGSRRATRRQEVSHRPKRRW